MYCLKVERYLLHFCQYMSWFTTVKHCKHCNAEATKHIIGDIAPSTIISVPESPRSLTGKGEGRKESSRGGRINSPGEVKQRSYCGTTLAGPRRQSSDRFTSQSSDRFTSLRLVVRIDFSVCFVQSSH